ncbi:MAG: AAA family ATPase [Chloroflexota bacterium]|nr:AAA family ATPase [Chloroflexota bacterium]
MIWQIPTATGVPVEISLAPGSRYFVVGPNGSGKSALIQQLMSSNIAPSVKRMPAHRQSWLPSGNIDLTPRRRREHENNFRSYESNDQSRWREFDAHARQSAILFDLIARENARSRAIAQHIDDGNPGSALSLSTATKSPFSQLNGLLAFGTLPVSIQSSNDEELLARNTKTGDVYSIAQMSDGERNAVFIAAATITAEEGSILVIDEPEQHLHRSIITPFLAALFAIRSDCSFVISTHELALPAADPTAQTIQVRTCNWQGARAASWDIDVLEPDASLPEDLKLAILGARRQLLFIEGSTSSLDLPLYSALLPDISVIGKGSHSEVISSVKILRQQSQIHQAEPFGLIDRDGRGEADLQALADSHVFAIEQYAVESLYYGLDSIQSVATAQAQLLGMPAEQLVVDSVDAGLAALAQNGVPEQLSAKRIERLVRSRCIACAPTWKELLENQAVQLELNISDLYANELAHFRACLAKEDLEALVSRYPIRDSNLRDSIAHSLKLKDRHVYERVVVEQARANNDYADQLRTKLGGLPAALAASSP